MKTSLREKMESILERMIKRINQLKYNAERHAESQDYASAHINKSKADQLQMVANDIYDALNS